MSWRHCWQVTIIEIGLKLGKQNPAGEEREIYSHSHQKPRLGYLPQLANTQVLCSEMFLGKTPESFEFVPKHKSSSYEEVEAEG